MQSQYSPARTKFVTPELPATHIPRPTVVHRLDDSLATFPVTLVAGFAGCGKSVLLAEWAGSQPAGTVAWLSCDVADADPLRFWISLIDALRGIEPAIGAEASDLVHADGQITYDAIASLVNELVEGTGNHVLVIDDLHLAARSAMEPLANLLERLPASLRVIISTRSDPPLPIHRWRARGQLGEVRAADLRLAAEEVGQLVERIGVAVSPDDAAVLADRTEGWAAGVQLAALSMRHEFVPADFIHTFAGTDRNITDFLVGEVLLRQTEDTVEFLLDTSVLDELSAPLCDALTGRRDSSAMLYRLEHENLFLIPLDNAQVLYRYHHLFAELLQRMLAARHPARALELHRAASSWYSGHEDPQRAIRHAILAEDPALVTSLLRSRTFTDFYTGTGELIGEWIKELNRSRVTMPAELILEYALALVMVGAHDDAARSLTRVEKALTAETSARVRARLALGRAGLDAILGEVTSAIEHADNARALVGPGLDRTVDGILNHVHIHCNVYSDDLAAAGAVYERIRAEPDDSAPVDRAVLTGAFAQAELEAGRVDSARTHAQTAVSELARLGGISHLGASDALRTLAMLAYEQDDLGAAETLLERCIDLVGAARPSYLMLTLIERARLWAARGDAVAAFADLDAARAALPAASRSPLVDRVTAYRARLLVEGGDVTGALALTATMNPGRRRSVAEIRGRLGEKDLEGARDGLARLAASHQTERELMELNLLRARLALMDPADDPRPHLEVVIDLGRATRFLRTLADEGREVSSALADALRHQPADEYSDSLAAVLERAIATAPAHNLPLFAGVMLSERELTVLQHLATRMTTREIAAELYVSMNTLSSHRKSIYRKLGVDTRAAATESARSLGIL